MKKIIRKSVELRNGKIIYGNHSSHNGITYCDNGLSIDNKLIVRKNGRKLDVYSRFTVKK